MASPTDLVVAIQGDGDEALPTSAQDALDVMRAHTRGPGHLGIGVHLRLLERPNPLLPPPHVWPLAQAQRLALIEGDVVLIHLIDLHGFVGCDSAGFGEITELRTRGEQVVGFVVKIAAGEMHISGRFLDDTLYSFQTMESVRDSIVAMACAAASEYLDDGGDLVRLDTVPEAEAFIQEEEEGNEPPFGTMPLDTYAGVRRNASRSRLRTTSTIRSVPDDGATGPLRRYT